MKNNEKGRSMVEMLGVLAIIGVLSAGGLAGYSKAMFKHKLNSSMDQLTMLVTNIRTMYGMQSSYSGLSVGQAYSLGLVPAAMKGTSASKLVSPFKGPVTISTTKAGNDSDEHTAFVITYQDIPVEACVAMSTADWGLGKGSGFVGVVASNTKAGADASSIMVGSADEGKALTVGDAIGNSGCGGGTDPTSSVSFKFY